MPLHGTGTFKRPDYIIRVIKSLRNETVLIKYFFKMFPRDCDLETISRDRIREDGTSASSFIVRAWACAVKKKYETLNFSRSADAQTFVKINVRFSTDTSTESRGNNRATAH